MDLISSIATEIFSNWPYLLIALALIIYRIVAGRFRRIPLFPVGLFIVYFLIGAAFPAISREWDPHVKRAMDVAMGITLYCGIARIVFFFGECLHRWRKKELLPGITRDLVLTVAYTFISLVILRTRGGVNLIGLITTSAVLTAVIGLAAQNVLGNLFAGLSLQISKPFRIGDWIRYHDHIGKVSSIHWEVTHINTLDDETVIIPNLDLSKSVIVNYHIPTPRHAIKIDVGVDYLAAPSDVKRILLDVCAYEPKVLKKPAPAARVIAFGDHAVHYQLRFFFEDHSTMDDLRSTIMTRIWYVLKRNGIRIPYPVRELRHAQIERREEERTRRDVRAEALTMLSALPIFQPLAKEALQVLARDVAAQEYGDQETIVRQGEPGDSLYVITDGACDVEVTNDAGKTSVVTILSPPAFFGEMSLLTGEPRSATVRARGDVQLFSISKESFSGILSIQPEIAELLARTLAKRQADTAEVLGRKQEGEERAAPKILARIKSFFRLTDDESSGSIF